jgi:hypothetical protein
MMKTLDNLNSCQGQFLHMEVFGLGSRETLTQIVYHMFVM